MRLAGLARGEDRVAKHHRRGAEVTAEPLLPLLFACRRIEAGGDPGIEDRVEVAVGIEERGNIHALAVLPGNRSGAIGPVGGDVVARIAPGGIDAFAVGDGGRDALRRRPLLLPERLAGGRIERRHLVAAGEDELIAAEQLPDDR